MTRNTSDGREHFIGSIILVVTLQVYYVSVAVFMSSPTVLRCPCNTHAVIAWTTFESIIPSGRSVTKSSRLWHKALDVQSSYWGIIEDWRYIHGTLLICLIHRWCWQLWGRIGELRKWLRGKKWNFELFLFGSQVGPLYYLSLSQDHCIPLQLVHMK